MAYLDSTASSDLHGKPPGGDVASEVSGGQEGGVENSALEEEFAAKDRLRLARQVLHNLKWQHEWSDLRIHSHVDAPPASASAPALKLNKTGTASKASVSSDEDTASSERPAVRPLPRPLVSGLPPRRLYVHPDEQIDALKRGLGEQDLEARKEQMWVLPTRLSEHWSLKGLAEIFDALPDDGRVPWYEPESKQKEWRQKRRLLLAAVEDDSTVVYYVVHDGIVKPRQN